MMRVEFFLLPPFAAMITLRLNRRDTQFSFHLPCLLQGRRLERISGRSMYFANITVYVPNIWQNNVGVCLQAVDHQNYVKKWHIIENIICFYFHCKQRQHIFNTEWPLEHRSVLGQTQQVAYDRQLSDGHRGSNSVSQLKKKRCTQTQEEMHS